MVQASNPRMEQPQGINRNRDHAGESAAKVPGIQSKGEQVKKYYRMTIESKAVPAFRAAVFANPGQAARDLSALLGYKYAHGVAVLTLLRKAGDILPVRAMGGQTQWWPAEQAAEQSVRWQAMRKEHDRKRKAANRKANPTKREDRIALDSPAAIKVLEAIAANPGIQSPQMAELTGCKLSHVKNVLTVISNAGKAMPIPGNGKTRHWYTQEAAAPILEARETAKRKSGPKLPTKRDRIAELSKHPDGVRMSIITGLLGIGQSPAGWHVGQMMKQGRLHRADRSGARLRWFDTAEKAAAWEAMPPVEPSEWVEPGVKAWANPNKFRQAIKSAHDLRMTAKKLDAERRAQAKLTAIGERIKSAARQPSKAPPLLKGSDTRNQVIRQKPGNDASVTLHGKATDMRGTVDYSRAKITICPAPVSIYRHQYDPGSEAHRAYVRQIEQLRGAA